jgi:hypothetical protein
LCIPDKLGSGERSFRLFVLKGSSLAALPELKFVLNEVNLKCGVPLFKFPYEKFGVWISMFNRLGDARNYLPVFTHLTLTTGGKLAANAYAAR